MSEQPLSICPVGDAERLAARMLAGCGMGDCPHSSTEMADLAGYLSGMLLKSVERTHNTSDSEQTARSLEFESASTILDEIKRNGGEIHVPEFAICMQRHSDGACPRACFPRKQL